MKKTIIFLLLSAAVLPVRAQNEPYIGGFGDGQSIANLISYVYGNTPQEAVYFGGSGGGDAADGQSPYAFINPPQFFPYFGGPGNGAASDTFNLFINSVPLPRSLLSFEGRMEEAGNLLLWKTEKEERMQDFLLERSADGRSFLAIATLKAAGSAAFTQYEHLDKEPLIRNNYYRLRLQNRDGSHDFSQTVLLIREGIAGPLIALAPNPARHNLRLNHERLPEGTVARVTDTRGVVLWQEALPAGSSGTAIPVEHWVPGTYLLQLSAPGGWVKTLRFVKQ